MILFWVILILAARNPSGDRGAKVMFCLMAAVIDIIVISDSIINEDHLRAAVAIMIHMIMSALIPVEKILFTPKLPLTSDCAR